MGKDTAEDPDAIDDSIELSSIETGPSQAEIDDAFGPAEPIEDELLTSVGDVPIVEPVPRSNARDASLGLTRALWFFGVAVTGLIALQTIQLFVNRPVAPRNDAPVVVDRSRADPEAPHTPAERVDRMLLDSRVQFARGIYEPVVRILEPLADDPRMLDANQRFEAYLLLAKAHRALGNVEKAQKWSLRATDQSIDRREPEQVFEAASSLGEEKRHADARRVLHQLLARADALSANEQGYRLKASVRVADAWWAEAVDSGAFAPLPGLDHDRGAAAPAKDAHRPDPRGGGKR